MLIIPAAETRRQNLALLKQAFGTKQALADAVGRSHSQISQLLNANVHTITGRERIIGDAFARRMETELHLDAGWLDTLHGLAECHAVFEAYRRRSAEQSTREPAPAYFDAEGWPFPRIEPARFWALGREERSFIEGGVSAMLERFEAASRAAAS